ncbi:MAG: B12-binding domain-containing radical SAM protein [Candidatus Omnitrophica bacterium]|nr:B12-binding domain-containing radical SAM protein [Candidatus Omnitrophota bacterium]
MKISLIMLPQWNICQPPLGIAYLTSFLRSKGFSVIQRDLSIQLFHDLPEDKKYIMESAYHLNWIHNFFELIYPQIKDTVNKWVDEIAQSDSRVIGFSVFSTNKAITMHVIQKIKERNHEKIIVIGGPQVSRYEDGPQILENEFVDYVVTDEGEETLYELILGIKNNKDIRKIKGILFREGNEKIDTGERQLINSLDTLPFPSISDFPLEYYSDLNIPILSSRGCVYRCSFCSEWVFWKYFRYRTGNNVYSEFKHHFDILGKNNFYMVDSLINGNIKELENLCDLIISDKYLKIFWGGKASLHPEMTSGLLRKMHAAGNRSIVYGIESGSVKVLKHMRKPFTLELAKRVMRETHETGIAVGIFWIIGFPTEVESDFQESIQFINEIKDYVDTVTPGYGCGILKGSELFKDYKKYGISFKEDGWYSLNTTPAIREERLKRFKEECTRLGIKMG